MINADGKEKESDNGGINSYSKLCQIWYTYSKLMGGCKTIVFSLPLILVTQVGCVI